MTTTTHRAFPVNYMVFATDKGWVIADRDGKEHGHFYERRVAQHRANLMNGMSVARSFEQLNRLHSI